MAKKRRSPQKPSAKKANTVKGKSKAVKEKAHVKEEVKNPYDLLQGKINKNFNIQKLSMSFNKEANFTHKINAISLQLTDKENYIVEFAVPKDQQESVEQELFKNNVPQENVRVVTCNPLRFFEPSEVHAKTFDAEEILNSGSAGAFIDAGNALSVFSAGHVLDTVGQTMSVALPMKQYSMRGNVTHSIGQIDLGIAALDNPADVKNRIAMFSTQIGKAQDNEMVRFYGATSEKQTGIVASLDASPVIDGQQFHGLIQLNIFSQPGDSGAAVINAHDEVIGLIIGGDPDPTSPRIYCSNLNRFKTNIPVQFRNNLKLPGSPTAKDDSRDVGFPTPLRRDVEIWIHKGTLTEVAKPGVYGRIMVASAGSDVEDIEVLTHHKHSFEDKDGGASMLNEAVYLFAVPLEYLVKQESLRGLRNHSPLVAVNVSREKKRLVAQDGLQKVTPCGNGLTAQSSLVPASGSLLAMKRPAQPTAYMPARIKASAGPETHSWTGEQRGLSRIKKPGSAKKTGRKHINYIINDYGQLILVKSNRPIKPWEKIVAREKAIHARSPRANTGIPRERLFYKKHVLDKNWKWEKDTNP